MPYTDVVLTIAGAVDTFLGTIFGISKITYDAKMKAAYEPIEDGMENGDE
ncbi:MAG: hypothetical protein J5725_00095 [Bacteroidales bacterium]|nr:hypothetical protein [Bacteroidales bacterium]